jgi:F-type H+-transporting ATPase subunit delta
VTAAEKLSDKHLGTLKSALKSVTGKDVDINLRVEPAIIGGLVVKLGSRMVDQLAPHQTQRDQARDERGR